MKNQLVNFVEVNFEEVKSFFYNQEREMIIEEFEDDLIERDEMIEFLNEQMNVSTSLELVEAINERSLGADLDDDSDCEELFEMIKLYIS